MTRLLSETASPLCVAERIVLAGRVQGIGARPAIQRLAERLGLGGSVQNTTDGIEIVVESTPTDLDRFKQRLRDSLPAGANLLSLRATRIRVTGLKSFAIAKGASSDAVITTVPPDVATCDTCLGEVNDNGNRRHGYPFTSCATCGPRYTIIQKMPFERADTAMEAFPLCEACAAEYRSVADRRFHAQTIACGRCGPRLWCVDGAQRVVGNQQDTLAAAARAIIDGKIVALKGLGGYQLLVDATNDEAVRRLRQRKQRPGKPLAVMVGSLTDAERLAFVDHTERGALRSAAGPIVLLRARDASGLADSVHPGLDTVGILLPTTPLHYLLMRAVGRPLVCTSGNRDGEPLEFDVDSAESRLADVGDLWLHHDRPIVRPIDDSVVRVICGRPVTVRLARGLAPLRLDIPSTRPALAAGGHMKSAAAWSSGGSAFLGPHVGDLDTAAARLRYAWHVADWQSLYRFRPETIVHDAHPDYFTTRWAEDQSAATLAVQHHHAHVVAGMVEHGWLDRTVLGVAWDGTGYGTDGTIWGGEFLVATARRFERFAQLRPFALPGGEAAVREPWRVAVALLQDAGIGEPAAALRSATVPPDELDAVRSILGKPRLSLPTTSAGRLFDGVAALVLDLAHSDFEAQPAMLLEAVADRGETRQYDVRLTGRGMLQLDWRPMIRQLAGDKISGVHPGRMAIKFHRGLAAAIVDVCRHRPDLPVILTGGVFQNRLLTELVVEMSAESSQPIGLPGVIPPGDGGLAAGQLAIALAE